jgi:multicomponent Na+:H+ antiporter subunit D
MLTLPLVVPLATTVLLLLTPSRPLIQRLIAFTGSLALLASTVAIFLVVLQQDRVVLQVSGWPAPFGITLIADVLAATLLVAASIVGVAVSATSFAGVDPRREAYGYHPLLQILLMGVCGAFLTGDLLNLYVWFEVMLVASFVLMSLHRTDAQVIAALTYVGINLIASAVLLTALGIVYGDTGTLNFADLAHIWSGRTATLDLVVGMLFLSAFGVKAALFPLFFWLPASYHTPPAPIGAIFAGLLTKVGVYALMRVFSLLFLGRPSAVLSMLLWMSCATMLAGLVGALAQRDFRRTLSFNLVGHIGYTTVGLAIGTPLALAGSILYMLHHIIVITALFLTSGVLLQLRRTTSLASLGSLYREHPAVALVMMVPLFSLAGLPPFSGFIGKLAVLRGAFSAGYYGAGAIMLAVGLLTLLSMARLWDEAFWKPAPAEAVATRVATPLLLPVLALTAIIVAISVGAGPLSQLTTRAAAQLLDRQGYIDAVLGAGR